MFDLNIRATFRYSSICNYPNGQLLAVAVRYSSKGRKKYILYKITLTGSLAEDSGNCNFGLFGHRRQGSLGHIDKRGSHGGDLVVLALVA